MNSNKSSLVPATESKGVQKKDHKAYSISSSFAISNP